MSKASKTMRLNPTEKLFSILMFIGMFIWLGGAFIRSHYTGGDPVTAFLLGVAPNFGVVWILAGIFVIYYKVIKKKSLEPKYFYWLIAGILFFLLIAEVWHEMFMNSSFDIWDIVASLIASAIWLFSYYFVKNKD